MDEKKLNRIFEGMSDECKIMVIIGAGALAAFELVDFTKDCRDCVHWVEDECECALLKNMSDCIDDGYKYFEELDESEETEVSDG